MVFTGFSICLNSCPALGPAVAKLPWQSISEQGSREKEPKSSKHPRELHLREISPNQLKGQWLKKKGFKRENPTTWDNMDGHGRHLLNEICQPQKDKYCLPDSTYLRYLKWSYFKKLRIDWWFPGNEEGKMGCRWLMDVKLQLVIQDEWVLKIC